jgi:hypothetical protein
MADIAILVKKLINTKRIADGGVATFACQGQGMDGYTELAEYRALIDKLETAGGARIPPRDEEDQNEPRRV